MISIIVPVYNAEKYLEECINSVLAQEIQDIEVILIDDGSTDNSLAICNRFANMDRRVSVYHKRNEGVSIARNKGLELAKGKYVAFVDADDIVAPDMFAVLLETAEQYKADIVSCSSACVVDEKIIKEEYGTNRIVEYSRKQALATYLIGGEINIGVWSKIFKREIIQNVRFIEQKRINEDKFFILEAILNSNKFVLNDVTKYFYYKRPESATSKAFDARWFDSLDIADITSNVIKAECEDLVFYSEVNKVKAYYWILLMMYKNGKSIEKYNEQYKRIVSYLKGTRLFSMRKFLSRNMILQILLLQISEPLLRRLKQRSY